MVVCIVPLFRANAINLRKKNTEKSIAFVSGCVAKSWEMKSVLAAELNRNDDSVPKKKTRKILQNNLTRRNERGEVQGAGCLASHYIRLKRGEYNSPASVSSNKFHCTSMRSETNCVNQHFWNDNRYNRYPYVRMTLSVGCEYCLKAT